MNVKKTINKILVISSLVILIGVIFTYNPVNAQVSPPPLSKGNTKNLNSSQAACPKDYEVVGGSDCCMNETLARSQLCPGGFIDGLECDSFDVYAMFESATTNSCYYDFGNKLIKKSPAYKVSVANATCEDALNLPSKYVCSYTPKVIDPNSQITFCAGPGGLVWDFAYKFLCCPKFDKDVLVGFEAEAQNILNTNNAIENCQFANKYNTLNKFKATGYTYKELKPDEVCADDAKNIKNISEKDKAIQECCTCISGGPTCQKEWATVPAANLNNTWTGIGCINRTQTGLATSIMRIFYGIGLVFLLIKLIQIGYMYQLGEPENIKDVRYGILAVILSFFVGTIGLIALRFVGLDVLGLGATTDIGNLLPTFAP